MRSGHVGAMCGGFSWMLLLGAVLGDVALLFLAAGGLLAGLAGGLRLMTRFPRQQRRVTGGGLIWMALWSGTVLAVWWDRIPESVGGMTTGKSTAGAIAAGCVLAAVAIVGARMLFATPSADS